MTRSELRALSEKYLVEPRTKGPLDIEEGRGATLYDYAGRAYLDFTGAWGDATLGYGHAPWADGVLEQSLKAAAVPPAHFTAPAALLARALCLRAGMQKAGFTLGEDGALEAMLKLARKVSYDRYGPGRGVVLTLTGCHHGESLSALAAAGGGVHDPAFSPYPGGFRQAEPEMEAIRKEAKGDVCAVLIELLQPFGSMHPLPRHFLHALAVFCAEQDWLLLIDETKTGAGRFGSLFAFQQVGILPDALSFGSGLSGGLPFGGILVNNRCRDVLASEGYGHGFRESPICAAAALSVLEALDENTLAKVREKGDYLRSGIDSLHLPHFGEPRGAGLMIGLPMDPGRDPSEVAAYLAERGLLCRAVPHGLFLTPPLTVTREEMGRALEILKEALK